MTSDGLNEKLEAINKIYNHFAAKQNISLAMLDSPEKMLIQANNFILEQMPNRISIDELIGYRVYLREKFLNNPEERKMAFEEYSICNDGLFLLLEHYIKSRHDFRRLDFMLRSLIQRRVWIKMLIDMKSPGFIDSIFKNISHYNYYLNHIPEHFSLDEVLAYRRYFTSHFDPDLEYIEKPDKMQKAESAYKGAEQLVLDF